MTDKVPTGERIVQVYVRISIPEMQTVDVAALQEAVYSLVDPYPKSSVEVNMRAAREGRPPLR